MDYKKKYVEALERAKKLYEQGAITESLNYIFPELKESEDERIKKALIELVKYAKKGCFEILKGMPFNVVSMDAMLAWLEKQGTKEVDPRYENLEDLLAADNIYQMSMNDAMVNEAKEKAVKALSELGIGKLLGFEKQGEQKPANKIEPKKGGEE